MLMLNKITCYASCVVFDGIRPFEF